MLKAISEAYTAIKAMLLICHTIYATLWQICHMG